MVRVRLIHGIAAALLLCVSLSCARADQKAKPVTSKDIDALRQTIEDQSKQIEALTQEIAHLTEVLEAHGISAGAAAASPSPAPESSPVTTSGSAQPAAAEGQETHTVTRGETLTSIAKHYKISVLELQKVNKIENDRTLQIGQILIIPTATPSPTPEEKKETQ